MINIIDLVLGILLLFYLLKHAGGVMGTLKNIAFILLFLMLFGIAAQFILNLTFAEKIHKSLKDSYLVKISHVLIRWSYPAIEWSAPKLDAFIKEKIIKGPGPNVKVPAVVLPEKAFPKLTLPELPTKLK